MESTRPSNWAESKVETRDKGTVEKAVVQLLLCLLYGLHPVERAYAAAEASLLPERAQLLARIEAAEANSTLLKEERQFTVAYWRELLSQFDHIDRLQIQAKDYRRTISPSVFADPPHTYCT